MNIELLPYFWQQLLATAPTDEQRLSLFFSIASTLSVIDNVSMIYHGKTYNPNLYTCIIAPPASGKGFMENAIYLLADVKKRLKQESETQEKPVHHLIVSADISKARLVSCLQTGSLLMYASELDSLAATMRNDWGNISPELRACFHHEPTAFYRKIGNETIEVERPKLSVLFCGTPNQIGKVFDSAGNGLFSRFIFSRIYAEPKFTNPFAVKHDYAATFLSYAGFVNEVSQLSHTQYYLTDSQAVEFTRHFERLSSLSFVYGEDALSVYFRAGLITARLMMIIQRFYGGLETGHFYIDNDIFKFCLDLSENIISENMKIFEEYFEQKPIVETEKPNRISILEFIIKQLPDQFTTATFISICTKQGVSESMAKYYLKKLSNRLFKKVEHGIYEKI